MITIDLDNLRGQSDESIKSLLAANSGSVTVSYTIGDYYGASSKSEIADSALVLWAIAERLAATAKSASMKVVEVGTHNAGKATVSLLDINVGALAGEIAQLHPLLNPADEDDDEDLDTREYWLALVDGAQEWLESYVGDSPFCFPELEQEYRMDLADAHENDPDRDFDDDDE